MHVTDTVEEAVEELECNKLSLRLVSVSDEAVEREDKGVDILCVELSVEAEVDSSPVVEAAIEELEGC